MALVSPGKPGKPIYFSSKTTKKETYGSQLLAQPKGAGGGWSCGGTPTFSHLKT